MTREEAIRILTVIRDEASESENAVCYVASEEDVEAIDMAIEALRTGTWRWVDFWTKDRARVKHGIGCSACGECYDWNDPCVLPSYCPECGAKMEGVTDEL